MSSTYIIKKSNTNYINALVKYCKDVPITSMDYVDGKRKIKCDVSNENYTCKDLLTIAQGISGDEFTIHCPGSLTVESIMPRITTEQLQSAAPNASDHEKSIKTHHLFEGYCDWLVAGYFTATAGMTLGSKGLLKVRSTLTKNEAILLIQAIDEYLRTGAKPEYIQAALTSSWNKKTQEQIDNIINSKLKITNSMLLEEKQAFVFTGAGTTFYLCYGDQPKVGTLDEFQFDLDDGFQLAQWHENPPEAEAIAEELNARFKTWKDASYAGDLIQADQTGLGDESQHKATSAPLAASSSRLFSSSSNQLNDRDDEPENKMTY